MPPLLRASRSTSLPVCPTCGQTILEPQHSVRRAGGAHHAECVLYAWRSGQNGRRVQPPRPLTRP